MIRTSVPAFILLLVVLAASEGRAQPDLILDDPSAEPFLWNGNYEYGEVRITNGARINMRKTEENRSVYASIRCVTFTLGEGSEIEGVGQGLEDLGGGGSAPMDGSGGNGGSYGGLGGRPSMDYGGTTFGTKDGLDIGPGGFGGWGDGGYGGTGGKGGAYIRIQTERCEIAGNIRMDGREGYRGFDCPPRVGCNTFPTGGGGGGGGGILVLARELIISESAVLSASGGRGGFDGYTRRRIYGFGGGGGRIKLFYENGNISPDALFNVVAGRDTNEHPVYLPAQPGTVHIQQVRSIDDPLAPNADLNNDGRVDSADLLLLQAQWGVTDATAGE